jgi:hypothetical protein
MCMPRAGHQVRGRLRVGALPAAPLVMLARSACCMQPRQNEPLTRTLYAGVQACKNYDGGLPIWPSCLPPLHLQSLDSSHVRKPGLALKGRACVRWGR